MIALHGEVDGGSPAEAAQAALAALGEIEASALPAVEKGGLRFTCSSLVLNAASRLGDVTLARQGKQIAERALEAAPPDQPSHYQCLYNVANAILIETDLDLPTAGDRETWEPQLIRVRIAHRDGLRQARRLLSDIASAESTDPHTRSSACCNLANTLDHSGRWAEAYDYYLRALESDPSNGNAAGNLAQLLLTRIQSGIGQTGHIAAVYDKYVQMAKSLREGTLQFAGPETADRWDSLQPTESLGHLSHGLEDPTDDYRRWVASHRLALSAAVEGLGSDGPRWDGAVIQRLHGSVAEKMTPPILAEMNVLKSDFLVSRRLAYEGISEAADGPAQRDDDSGYYVDTLDYSLYGTQYSKLLLAQRSALDVLDKTAVVANEYFVLGDRPDKVSFRRFWATDTGQVRDKLVKGAGLALPAFALSELAFDMGSGGMYESSQALRNAGTHRIVHAAFLDSTGVTVDSRSRVDLFEVIESTILALQVTRSAYLYLIDLVASWNRPSDHEGDYVEIPTYEYMQFPDPDGQPQPSDADDVASKLT